MPVAQGVDAFDGRSASETPVKSSVAKSTEAQPALPRAVGRPAISAHDGAANTRSDTQTLQAEPRVQKAGRAGPSTPAHFADATV